jgi:hypothetical protein
MIDISDWNVRIIQNGEIIEDVLYNIYNDLSLVFDENEGNFLHEDYQKALEETDREHRSSLFPMRNYHISKHDYFSVSVSLETYIKMLKGEKKFPHNFNKEERKKHSIIFMSLVDDNEIKEYIEKLYKEL